MELFLKIVLGSIIGVIALFIAVAPFLFIWKYKKTKDDNNMVCAGFTVFVQTFFIALILGFYLMLRPELEWWSYAYLIAGSVIGTIMLGSTFNGWNKLYAGSIGFICLCFLGFCLTCAINVYSPPVIRGHSFRALERVVGGFRNYLQLDFKGQLALAFKLKPALRHDDKYVKMGALLILETFGKNVSPVTAEILKLIENEDKEIRLRAIQMIPQIGPPAKKVIPNLIKILSEPSYSRYRRGDTLYGIARALRSMEEESVYYLLVDCLSSDNKHLAKNAVSVLQEMGVSGDIIVPDLLKLLKSKKMEIRINALEILKYVSGKRKQKVLSALSDFSKTAAPKEREVLEETFRILEYKSKK